VPQAVQPRKRSASTHPASFTDTALRHGLPASTLTDNGTVYTNRFTNGHNDFERLIATLGITQKNGHPGHPQTQGKIERFHQTLKRWLKARPRPATIADMQRLLDDFAVIPVLINVTTTVTVLSKNTHHLIASHTVDPNRNYWRNKQKDPGRWPGSSVTDDATQV
jgi:transposase InsO family protein